MSLPRWFCPAARVTRGHVRFVGGAVLALAGAMAAVGFATADRGRTAFGQPLGNDFACFYVAADVLNHGEADRLYDFALHGERYHDLLPAVGGGVAIPYVHPPAAAAALRPLATLPFGVAVAGWLAISAGLYLAGTAAVLRAAPAVPPEDRPLVLLLAVSFEPFLMECWLGGQLSAVGFLFMAAAAWAWRAGRPVAAGVALAGCLYKPTLLVLFPLLLVIGRRWHVLLGFAVGAAGMAAFSVGAAGWGACADYGRAAAEFGRVATEGGLELRTWKYVDLNSFFRLLLGGPSATQRVLFLAAVAVPLGLLVQSWWRWNRLPPDRRPLLWAATLTWTLVLNLYVGVYDSVLAVLAAVLTADHLYRTRGGPATWPAFGCLLLLLYLTPWVTQPLARLTGVQVYTLVLAALGLYQLRLVRAADDGDKITPDPTP